METIRLVKGSAAKVCLEADLLPAVVSEAGLPAAVAAASAAGPLAVVAPVADLLVAAAVMEGDLLVAAAVTEADRLTVVLGTGDHVGN